MSINIDQTLADRGWGSCHRYLQRPPRRKLLPTIAVAASFLLSACTTPPLMPYTAETQPLVLVPVSLAGVQDRRTRFREIFCQVLEARGPKLADYRPCGEVLARVRVEASAPAKKVDLGPSRQRLVAAVVPGVGWDCISGWMDPHGSMTSHVRQFGYDMITLKVDGLSSSTNNAGQIRDAVMQMPFQDHEARLVLIGYSKGAPDVLEAVVSYPEVRRRVAAVVSIAGAIGGSPLANDADQSELNLLTHWPEAQCSPGDGGAIESLRPATRKTWMAENSLPSDVSFYSLVTMPQPERVSLVLKPSYKKLSQVDARNDGQLVFYDQVIPGSALIGFLNADHWAPMVPIARSHPSIGATLVNHNDFPREALLEALLRLVEEDLAVSAR